MYSLLQAEVVVAGVFADPGVIDLAAGAALLVAFAMGQLISGGVLGGRGGVELLAPFQQALD